MGEGTQGQQAGDQAGQAAEGVRGAVGGLAGGQGQQGGGQQQGEGNHEDSYHNDESSTTTVEEDKSPKGPLADLLNLEILASPEGNTTTLESGDSEGYHETEGSGQGGEGQG